MALIIEDGTNVAGANSYVTEAELQSYLDQRGLILPAGTNLQPLIFRAMDYLESLSFNGVRTFDGQALSFPRQGIYVDNVELAKDSIPTMLKQALCRLAYESNSQELLPTSNGKVVVRERVEGAVDVSYDANLSSSLPSFALVDALLKPLVSGGTFGQLKVKRG